MSGDYAFLLHMTLATQGQEMNLCVYHETKVKRDAFGPTRIFSLSNTPATIIGDGKTFNQYCLVGMTACILHAFSLP